jgi:hypothetical protein
MSDIQYTRTELLNWIRKLADEDGPPTKKEMQNHPDSPSESTYDYRFPSYNQAVRDAGYEPNPAQRKGENVYTYDEMIEWIDKLADEDGPPTIAELDDHPKSPSGAYYSRRFPSYNQAVRDAGYEPNRSGPQTGKSDDELLGWIDAFVAEFGIVPSPADFRDGPTPTPNTYRDRFGSFREAVRQAGYTPRGVEKGGDGE